MESYLQAEGELLSTLASYDGKDTVVIYLSKENKKKILPKAYSVKADSVLTDRLKEKYGEKNVAIK